MVSSVHDQTSAKANPSQHVENQPDEDLKGSALRGTKRIRSVALAEALAYENPRPWRKSFIRLYMCLAVAYMCSSTNGFDANTFGE